MWVQTPSDQVAATEGVQVALSEQVSITKWVYKARVVRLGRTGSLDGISPHRGVWKALGVRF